MQELLKRLVCTLHENGLADITYLALQFTALTICIILAARFGRKLGFGFLKALIAVVIEVALVYAEMAVLCMILEELVPAHIPIMNSYYNNVGRTFILVPLSGLLVAVTMRMDLKKIMIMYSFAQPIIWGMASLPCLLAGCCRGYPWQWGIYNYEVGTFVFPTQLVNGILLMSLAGLVVLYARKKSYQPDGREYPVALILIGLIRFCTEYIMDSPKIIYGLSSLSFDSMVMIIVGILSYSTITLIRVLRAKKIEK